ncbi:MAG: aminotransferase class V-fold PLP-dependent enzyme, partial [Planctomycetota bacterium]
PLPNRFEAGTPDIAGAIGLGAAIDYVLAIGFDEIQAEEDRLLEYASRRMQEIQGLRIIGAATQKASVISFVLESPSIAPMDIATALANEGIAIRTGHHCCMPLMGQLQVSGTSRVSLAMYNTQDEIDHMVQVLTKLVESRQKPGPANASNASESNGSDSVDGIVFAKPASDSVQGAAEDLAEEFLDFDDPKSKTELLMELGQSVPDCFEPLKKISTAVPGCMSEVYLVGRPQAGSAEVFEFSADSNAEIVRGLIGVLQSLFSGQKAGEILAFDIESFFRQIGLDQFVSTQRRSGLDGMIRRIRTLAESIQERAAS